MTSSKDRSRKSVRFRRAGSRSGGRAADPCAPQSADQWRPQKDPKERMTKKYANFQLSTRFGGSLLAAALLASAGSLHAQVRAQQPNYPVPGASATTAPTPTLQLPPLPAATPITPNGKVVEDVIARVNDQIITRSEFERSERQLMEEARQQNVPQVDAEAKLHDLLRDMIDQQLLISKGKELGITGDTETMRRLDDIRKQNHLESMEALQKAAEQQGVSYEDFKQQIRNSIVTNQVVQDEVGRHLNLTHAQEEAYYAQHAKDFQVPEQVHLSEILIPTPENASEAQLADAQRKADEAEAKLKAGASFAEVAKASSGGPTAAAGGDLGDFKRGSLGEVLEKATFSLPVGGVTEPIRTRQGFVILKVDSHQQAGVPALADVERQVQEAIYLSQLQPALRAYLTKAREDAYIDIKPGFVDTGSSRQESKPVFTAYAPPAPKKKQLKKQRVEQQRADKAQADLAAAREKLAAKKAANDGSAQPAGGVVKRHRIRKEKIRFGQAPRNSLPDGPVETADAGAGPAANGQPAGAALSPTESTTTITTGTGFQEAGRDPLAPTAVAERKTRFTDREKETEEKRAQDKLTQAEAKASARPVAATPEDNVTEKHQAAPLGLNGNTAKKKEKVKRAKDEPKERLQDKPKPVDTPTPIAPTVNPALGGAPAASSDRSTLPPATTPAPGAPPQGQPIPAATSADPNAPATTPAPR
ncbi:MAG TPA: peptidylprolyl isomerase [Acidobacteriaceae bacterium]|jgi:peptidyl-prolyl cis-trans isomerase SurA|nr:peptidylprolyl isomerase [Acidobacteriaceae bacterium]